MFSDSSINWCELDYVKSAFIAEYWNTLTGLFLCLSAFYCLHKNSKENINGLQYSNWLLFLVGVGTMLFHGTLIYFWQLFDEIPMMLIVIEYYRLLTKEIYFSYHTISFKINYKFMYHTIPVIIASYYVYPKLQVFMFQGSLGVFMILLIYSCYSINSRLNRLFYQSNKFNYVKRNCIKPLKADSESELPTLKSSKKIKNNTIYMYSNDDLIDENNSIERFKLYAQIRNHIKYHNYQGTFLLIFSLLIWNIDNHYCQHHIELHAIWHITTSIGMYSCNEIMKSYIKLNMFLV